MRLRLALVLAVSLLTSPALAISPRKLRLIGDVVLRRLAVENVHYYRADYSFPPLGCSCGERGCDDGGITLSCGGMNTDLNNWVMGITNDRSRNTCVLCVCNPTDASTFGYVEATCFMVP